MPAQITNYQCPACTGPLQFSPESGKLECEYCSSIYEMEQIEALYAEKERRAAQAKAEADAAVEDAWDTSGLSEDWGEDAEGMKAYNCPSCGAQLVCDETTAATSCPYCGNPTVVPGQFSGMLKPDFVIPFRVTKERAVAALKEHYKGKFFLPRAFTDENHIEEIKGVYVPFWMFDGEAEGEAWFAGTRTRTYTRGDNRITETDHYTVTRAGSLAFEKVPVDASTKMPDEYMDAIEPYDYAELIPFSTACLPGFLADKYDVSLEDSLSRAESRCRGSLESALSRTVTGYEGVVMESSDIRLKRGKVHYALLPVWLLSTRWEGKTFLFAVNGQTGRQVGDLPVSKKKYWATFAAIAAAVAAVGALVSTLMIG